MNLSECSKAQPSGKTYAQYRANFDDFNTRNVVCELFTELNKEQSRLQIAEEWNYCKLGKKITDNKCDDFKQSDAIYNYFINRETYQCDQKMINALLYDIWITSTCTNVWFEIFKKTGGDKSQTNNVDFAFLATRGGLVRFYDNGGRGDSKSIDQLKRYGPGFQKNRYPLYYRRAASYPPGTYVFSHPNHTFKVMMMARAWSLGNTDQMTLKEEEYSTMVVSGLQVKYEYLKNNFKHELSGRDINRRINCAGILQPSNCEGKCCQNEIKCYIIDDFGYVFLSGDELDLGRHISDVDGPLFHSLSRKDKIFKPYKMKDYQGICNEPQANGPIDNQSNDDLIGEYNSMRPCTKEYSIYKLDQEQANKKRDQDLFTFCTTEAEKNLNTNITEQSCTPRNYKLRQLKNTNLALVFVDCCQSDVVAQKVNSGDRSNCTMDPSDGNMPLGQDIPDEFNADNGLLLGDYFSNILTAKEPQKSREEICRATRKEVMPRKEIEGVCADIESAQQAKDQGCSADARWSTLSFILLIILAALF